jgi:glucose-6-phosphate 1-dehydrogenase
LVKGREQGKQQMNRPENQILVIFGASGDLADRMLIPALFRLWTKKVLPQRFAILGVGRTPYDDNTYRQKVSPRLKDEANSRKEEIEDFVSILYYQSLNTQEAAEYSFLQQKLQQLQEKLNIPDNVIYYLATPPLLYTPIAVSLSSFGLNLQNESKNWKRIILEKPFGYDLPSAKQLHASLHKDFQEDQIYRIDHYLGKETIQNIMVTRFVNGFLEPLWNRNFVDRVEITASESLGIENRGGYYDGSGALRDMVQNHLLQTMAFVAMEPPASADSNAIRNEILKVFQSLQPFHKKLVNKNVIRGQYTRSKIGEQEILGYREEQGVKPDSRTETYVALKTYIDNWRWGGVPFYIRTGKRMPTRVTEIVIHFKTAPHHIFCANEDVERNINQLIIRIQPDEGLLFKLGMKVPGAGFIVQPVNMDFKYSDLSDAKLPTAYERLLLDCMNGDSTLYSRADAVEASWDFVQPILNAWQEDPESKIYGYPAGTWGPEIADSLFEKPGITWRYPCKNLSNDGQYCEL